MEELENDELHEDTPLTKEEILERSRAENKNGDERARKKSILGFVIAISFAIILIFTTMIIEQVYCENIVFGYALFSLCWGMGGIMWLTGGIFYKKPLNIFIGALSLLNCGGSYFLFIVNLLEVFG